MEYLIIAIFVSTGAMIFTLWLYTNSIVERLEEIRCGVIDVENVCEKILSNAEGYETSG